MKRQVSIKTKPKPPPAPKTKPKTVHKPPPAPTKSNDDYKKQSTGKSPVYDGNDVSNPSFGLSAESKAKQASKYNLDMERQVVEWVNRCVNQQMQVQGGGAGNFKSSLKDV
eukprot:169736_1